MTQRDRFLCAALGGKADQVPAAPYMGNYGAALAGVPLGRYCRDARTMADAQARAWELLGQDAVVAQSDAYYIAEGFGCVVDAPEDSTPRLAKPAAASVAEALSLKVPDPLRDGRMGVYIDAVRLLRERFGNRVAVRGTGTGPFSLASYLGGGTQAFLMEIAEAEAEGDDAHSRRILDLMELSSDALIAFLKALLAAGSDVAQAGDSLASPSMISPAVYAKYALPFEKKVFDAVGPEARRRGAATLLHICGRTTAILPLMASSGADVLELDSPVDLAEARRLCGRKVALMGNIEPSAVLLQGTPGTVSAACAAALDAADAASGGFILGSGCEVPPATPLENMKALVMSARVHGGSKRPEGDLDTDTRKEEQCPRQR